MSDFNKYVFCEFPEELEGENGKIVNELQEKEDECRWTLAMEIAFSVSIDEFEEVDMAKPGQICWKYALEAIIKGLLLYFLVHDNCLLFML